MGHTRWIWLALAGALPGCSGCAPGVLGHVPALVALEDGGQQAAMVTVSGTSQGHQDGPLRGPTSAASPPGSSGPVAFARDGRGHWLALDRDRAVVRDLDDPDAGPVVGTGADGDGDGPAAQAALRAPKGLARCPDGSLWVADSGNRSLKRLKDGVVTRVERADGGVLMHPRGLACADDGTLWIADYGASALLQRAPDGTLSLAAEITAVDDPSRPDTETDPPAPLTVALWPDGRVLVAGTSGLHAFDPRSQRLTRLPLHQAGQVAYAGRATSVAVDAAGHRGWVALPQHRRIAEVDELPDGGLWLSAGDAPSRAFALAYLPERGHLLVSSQASPELTEYDPATGQQTSPSSDVAVPPPADVAAEARFDAPSRLAADGDALWVLQADGVLRHVDAAGRVTTAKLGLALARTVALAVRGEARWAASGAQLVAFDAAGAPGAIEAVDGEVGGLTVADDGALWRSDPSHHTLWRRALAGAPWVALGQVRAPGALAAAESGAVWVVDEGRAVLHVAADGATVVRVDHRSRPSSGDGALADDTVGLEQVADLIALDADRLLLADGHRIRVLSGSALLTAVGKFDSCTADGFGVNAHLNHPSGLAWRGGALWVADRDNHRLRQVTLP